MSALTLALCLLVAVPPAHIAPGVYKAPPRVPDEMLAAPIPDWQYKLWTAVRKVQGENDRTWAGRQHFADMIGKKATQVSTGLTALERGGYLAHVGDRGRDKEFRCHVPLSRWRLCSEWVWPACNDDPDAPEVEAVSVNPGDSVLQQTVNPDDSLLQQAVNPDDRSVNPDDPPVNPDDSDTYKEESGQGIRSRNPLTPPTSILEGGGPAPVARLGRGGEIRDAAGEVVGGRHPRRLPPELKRPDGGVNGNRLAREVAAAPIASRDTVAAALAETERLMAEGARRKAEADEARRQQRRAARPRSSALAGTTEAPE